jgi:hypothetical protein
VGYLAEVLFEQIDSFIRAYEEMLNILSHKSLKYKMCFMIGDN